MTPEQSKEWFKLWGDRSVSTETLGGLFLGSVSYEALYQAFKARLKAEASLNVWPESK